MFRRIVFLVPALALALLAVNALDGLAGKIGAGGVAWAQDSPAADDGDQNATDTSSSIKFSGKGRFDATLTTPCSSEDYCYSLTGTVTKTSIKGLAPGDLTGDVTLASCTINKRARKECCTLASTQTYSFSEGDLDVMFSGMACGKSFKHITAKNAPFEIMGGTGLFSGADGSGKAKFTFDADTDMGTFSFEGNLTE
jgi:hypothetical protein